MITRIILLMLSFAIALPVAAQIAPAPTPAAPAIRGEIRDLRQNARQEIKQFRQEDVQQFRQKREELKSTVEQRQAEFKTALQNKRAELKARLDVKQAELKERLKTIKDERKKQVVERINQQLDALNERRLDHFSAVLVKLENILRRIGDRADKAKAHDRDVSSVKSAITSAERVIAESRSAIEAQGQKTYTIEVAGEETLKADVSKARQALHADLAKVQATVKDAHDAVRRAAVALAQIPKIDELEVQTEGASTAPAPPTATTPLTTPPTPPAAPTE